jgi:P27 family predicted phage terminase small subunit
MGRRGPARKSAGYLEIHGSRIDDGRGMAPPPGVPFKPTWLGEKASEVWDETIAELQEIPGLLSTLDGGVLALYCHSWQQFHDAQAIVAAKGMVCESEKGGNYQHPAVGISNKAREQITKLGSLFGMNPLAREGMIIENPKDDELEALLR